MRASLFVWISASLLLVAAAGCSGRADVPGTDAGPGIDAASPPDGGTDDAAAPPEDGGQPLDASAPDASMPDASGAIDGGPWDGGGGVDACVAPPCAAPPDGCHYEGATSCTCGTLVCTPPSGCDPACSATEYCDLCAATQTCVTRPPDSGAICTAIYMPVCGCDGRTYGNSCELGAAGIPLMHSGECGSTI